MGAGRGETRAELSVCFKQPSSTCCFATIPATMVKSSFNCGSDDERGTASTCTGSVSAAAEQPSARNHCVNSTISSSVGVGLCSNIFNFKVGGRPSNSWLRNTRVTGVAIGTNEIRTQQQQSMYNYTKFIPKITIRKLAFVQVTQDVGLVT